MNDIGNTMIYRDGFLMIIMNQHVIDINRLKWSEGERARDCCLVVQFSSSLLKK